MFIQSTSVCFSVFTPVIYLCLFTFSIFNDLNGWLNHSQLNLLSFYSFPPTVMTQEKEPSRDIRCEFCGEFFENRKGLSSHARSHLRHMGITEWSVNGSPIDTLWEVMRRQGTTPASVALGIKGTRTGWWDFIEQSRLSVLCPVPQVTS